MYYKLKEIYDSLDEAGDLHNDDCCTRDNCDAMLEPLQCCDNAKYVKYLLDSAVKEVVEFMSSDLGCENEEQRKTAVRMLLAEHFTYGEPQSEDNK